MSGQFLNLGSSGNAPPMTRSVGVVRPIDSTPFQVSIQRPAFVTYVIEVDVDDAAGGGATFNLFAGPASPGTSQIVTAEFRLNTIGRGRVQLPALLLPADFARIIVNSVTGANTIVTYISGTEILL